MFENKKYDKVMNVNRHLEHLVLQTGLWVSENTSEN